MKDLTNEQISSIWHAKATSGGRSFYDIIRAAIKADRELNGRTVEPAEQSKGQEAVAFDVTIQDDAAKMLHTMVSPAFDGDEDCTPIRLLLGNGHSGYGLYVASADYPEEGAELLAEITTTPAQPAREWVDLPAPDTRTDAHIDTMGEPAYSVELVQSLFSELREKNAGQPAADDKAGGEVVAWQERQEQAPGEFTIWYPCKAPSRRATTDGEYLSLTTGGITYQWRPLYTRPQPQAEVRVPDGYALVPLEPTREMLNAAVDVDSFKLGDISPIGFRCSPQQLFERCYRAMLAAAPKQQDDLPAILKKQAS